MLGIGWGYPCIVSMKEGALCFSIKGLGVSFGGHGKVSGYHLLRQLVLQELLQHLRPPLYRRVTWGWSRS